MSYRLLLAATILVGAVATGVAQECPAADAALEAREAVILKAPTCRQALEMMKACAYGASGDVALGAVVTGKCEADFLSQLCKGERAAYQRRVRGCDRKYRNESGTLYRSFEAFCRAAVARDYSDRFRTSAARK